MEMRKLFSNSGAEINKKEMAAFVVLVVFVIFIERVCSITYESIYSGLPCCILTGGFIYR